MDVGAKRNLKVRYGLLGGTVVLVVLAWCGGWFYLSARLKDQISAWIAQPPGPVQSVSCPDLEVGGFPFRFEIACSGTVIALRPSTTFSLGGMKTVALVYKPWHVITEVTAPLTATAAETGLDVEMTWQIARSSLIFDADRLAQFDLSADQPSVTLSGAEDLGLAADKVELHTRSLPGASETLEAFLSIDQFLETRPIASLPALDLKVHVQLPKGMQLMRGDGLASLADGGGRTAVKLVWASMKAAQSEAEVSGDLEIDALGYVYGTAVLTVAGADDLSARMISAFPDAMDTVRLFEGAVMSFGERFEDETGAQKIRLPLTIENGRISVGMIPLWVLPPLPLGGR